MEILLTLIGIILAAAILWVVFSLRQQLDQSRIDAKQAEEKFNNLDRQMRQELFQVTQTVTGALGNVQKSFDDRLKDNTNRLDTRLENAARSVSQVHSVMSQVLESNKQIHDLGKDISKLQDILRAPKLRGNLGELFLEELLSSMFPKQNYSLQHAFKSGEKVDAVIRLKGGMISVDSKFPLENFQKMYREEDANEKKRLRRAFVSDVKKHISAISDKYIVPDEGTLDFALMYIPAENVYYETIIKSAESDSLLSYAFQHKVVPVSPNTLYVYIHTILLGLKGMEIEEHAKSIMSNLKRLSGEYDKFRKDFDVLGKHVVDSKNKFDTADKRLDKFEIQLEKASIGDPNELESENATPKNT